MEDLMDFAKWYCRPPAQEIQDTEPSPLPSLSQPDQSKQQPPSYAPGVFSPIYTLPQPPPTQHPIIYHTSNPRPEQPPRAGTPEFHIHTLSRQLSPILSSPTSSDPARLRPHIQQCFDTYFAQVGASAFIPDASTLTGAPLGSISVFELENELNALLRDRFEVVIMKRDRVLKAIVLYPGVEASAMVELVQIFARDGWMRWQQLEAKEAEILARRFEGAAHI
jgi:hypothetical protein